jgi:hypothetical protein
VFGDFVGTWSVERSRKLAVGKQDHAIGVSGRHRVVGDHHDRSAILIYDLA